MKKLLLSVFASFALGTGLFAQVPVTFQVDMRAKIVSPLGVHIAGDLQMPSGAPGNWDPSTTALSDANADGIYEVILNLPAGTYSYKYVNGNAWGSDENPIPAACNVGGNRSVTVGTTAMTVPVHAYGSCDPNPTGNPIMFLVDMKNETVSANGVHVAGNFQAAAGFPGDWDPATTQMTDPDGDNIYEYVAWLNATGTYQYKFVNGNAWSGAEGVPATCNVGGNRETTLANGNGMILPSVCFSSCDPCPSGIPDTVYVRAWVNMSVFDYPYAPYNQSIDSVSMAGGFQSQVGAGNWTPGATLLSDPDGDKVYSGIFKLVKGTYPYKFVHTSNGVNQWEDVPGACAAGGNREMNLNAAANGDTVDLPMVCYGSCVGNCPPIGAPINVTFVVDLNNAPSATVGPFVAGSYQYPLQWQKTQNPMVESAPGSGIFLYTATQVKPVRYEYKYFYGNDTTAASGGMDNIAEFLGLTVDPGPCAGLNPFNQYNRILELTGATQDTILPAFEFGSCTFSIFNGIDAYLDSKGGFVIAPNPMTDYAELRFNNDKGLDFNVTITNVTGQVIMRKENIRTSSVELNRKDLTSGIYFISIWNSKGERATRKLIVE